MTAQQHWNLICRTGTLTCRGRRSHQWLSSHRGGGAYCPIRANNVCICFNPPMCIHTSVIGVQRVNCACKHTRKKRINVEKSPQCLLFDHASLHSVPFPIISNSHYTESTCLHGFVGCPHSREKATHTHTLQVVGCVNKAKGKNWITNAVRLPLLAPTIFPSQYHSKKQWSH